MPTGGLADDIVWATTRGSGELVESASVLDWGDIAPATIVEGMQFGYATNSTESLEATITFYTHENGCESTDRVVVTSFVLTDLPGSFDPQAISAWLVTLDLAGSGMEFALAGEDLDGDYLTDFGYEISFADPGGDVYIGQPIADADPNEDPFPAPGIEDGWYAPDCVMSPYGGDPFAQLYLYLYGTKLIHCSNPGESGKWCYADIANEDCVVDLSDLATLLANYGMTSGATHYMGDLYPPGGDGAIDLSDLAELLAEYGDDCN